MAIENLEKINLISEKINNLIEQNPEWTMGGIIVFALFAASFSAWRKKNKV